MLAAALEARGIGVFRSTTHRGGRAGSNADLESIINNALDVAANQLTQIVVGASFSLVQNRWFEGRR